MRVQSTRACNVVQALMESVTLSQPQPKFPPELIKFLAKVHSAWHVAIPLLETHVIIFPSDTRCFHALAELYRLVQEDDLLYGLWKNRCATPTIGALAGASCAGVAWACAELSEARRSRPACDLSVTVAPRCRLFFNDSHTQHGSHPELPAAAEASGARSRDYQLGHALTLAQLGQWQDAAAALCTLNQFYEQQYEQAHQQHANGVPPDHVHGKGQLVLEEWIHCLKQLNRCALRRRCRPPHIPCVCGDPRGQRFACDAVSGPRSLHKRHVGCATRSSVERARNRARVAAGGRSCTRSPSRATTRASR